MRLVSALLLFGISVASPARAFDLGVLKGSLSHASDLNHRLAFQRAADQLVHQRFLGDEARSATILYPAGGSHVAIFDMAQTLAAQLPQLDDLTVAVTEIDQWCILAWQSYFDLLARQDPNITGLTRTDQRFEQGSSVTWQFVDSSLGRPVRYKLVYSLNRVDPAVDVDAETGRVFYYRQADFDAADIVVSHDAAYEGDMSEFVGDFAASLSRSAQADEPSRRWAFLFEDMNKFNLTPAGKTHTSYDLLPGRVGFVDAPYGCTNLEDEATATVKFTGAALYVPDTAFFRHFVAESLPLAARATVMLAYNSDVRDQASVQGPKFSPAMLGTVKSSLLAIHHELGDLGYPAAYADRFMQQFTTRFLKLYP